MGNNISNRNIALEGAIREYTDDDLKKTYDDIINKLYQEVNDEPFKHVYKFSTRYMYGDTGYHERDVYFEKHISKLKDMFKQFCNSNSNIKIKYNEHVLSHIAVEFHIGSKL